MANCLSCYQPLEEDQLDFHPRCSKAFFGTTQAPRIDHTLGEMDELAVQVVQSSVAVPGVQAKLSMSVVRARLQLGDMVDRRLTIVGAMGGDYILKPPAQLYAELPANEHLTMRMAEAFGIRVVPSSLIRLQSGELAYLTRRIDRTPKGGRLHMLDMYQVLDAEGKYRSSMEKVAKALGAYSAQPLLDKLYLFELTLFSFLTGNNDMHLKNFSMLLGPDGWALAPAYDLLNVNIILAEDHEELALTLAGKKSRFKRSHFDDFGRVLGLNDKQLRGAYKRIWAGKDKALAWIARSFLSAEMQASYTAVLLDRYERLYPPADAPQ